MAKGKDAEIITKAKKDFKAVVDVEERQREREREDLRFQVPEYQWDEDARKQRKGGVIGGQVTPPRPMLSISLLTQPLQLIQNQAATAKLGVEIHPVSENADQELAEIKQGLYRRIERDSNADQARLWALDRAKQCGRGWYRVSTQYDEDGDHPSDQEINIERILQQDMVYIDPAAQEMDYSDARWGMVVAWVPVDEFKRDYPKAEVPTNDQDFKSWIQEDPDWVKSDSGENAVLVAEYFYKEYEKEKLEYGEGEYKQSREIENVTVKWCKLTAKDVLEKQDWNGKHIPLIPVIGRELQPFNEERRYEGIVRQARDGQKFFNYAASSLVEGMALEPKAPFIGAAGQFEGHEEKWDQANVRNWSYMEYNPTSFEGHLTPAPQRAQVDGTRMNLAMTALQQAKSFVQAATAVYEPSLGQMPEDSTAQSGRAIVALQQQSDAGTSQFLQNLAKISMNYEAKVVMDLMPAIYDRPGRVTQVLGATDDEPKMVMLGKPFQKGDDDRPQEYIPPPPVQGPDGMPMQPPDPPGVKNYDLSKGKYSISVSVGKSFQTRLQEGQAEIGAVLEKNPSMVPMIGDLYYKFRDFPGSKEISERLKKVREKEFPGLDDGEDGMTLEQAQTQMQQMEEKLKAQGQQMQQMQQALEVDKAKQEATIAKTQMETQADQAIAMMKAQNELTLQKMEDQTRIIVETMRQQGKSEEVDTRGAHTALGQSEQHRHEKDLKAVDVVMEDTRDKMKPEEAR